MATTLSTSAFLPKSNLSNAQPCTRQRIMFGRPNFREKYVPVERDVKSSEDVPTQNHEPTLSDNEPIAKHDLFIYCRIYNPSFITSSESQPLVIVHGGPLLPSDYLYPLVHQIPKSRSIIFYDQLGCGQSSKPEDESMYSIQYSVSDLEEVINFLQLKKFHLLGHSFGGIIAYEFLKRQLIVSSIDTEDKVCASLTLANCPSDMLASIEEYAELQEEIKFELMLEKDYIEKDGGEDEETLTREVHDLLQKRNECRTETIPSPLVTAIHNRGTVWSSPEVVSDYVARPPFSRCSSSFSSSDKRMPPVLLIRGEFDFITEKCIEGWRKIFNKDSCCSKGKFREEIMQDCAHYPHLEKEKNFGELVQTHCFINDY